MPPQPGMYPGMHPQNPGMMPPQQQGVYMQQYNPGMAQPHGQQQHPMQYQAGQPMPPQQQQPPPSMSQPGQLPQGPSNQGVPVTAPGIPPPTTTAGGIDPQSAPGIQPVANPAAQQTPMVGNLQVLPPNVSTLGSGDVQLPPGAPFNLHSMASALPPQPGLSNPYNSTQVISCQSICI